MTHTRSTASHLVLNGALLILGGYLCGPAIPLSPYPRLMLAAHSAGFLASGIVSVLAGLMVRASFTSLSAWGARVAVAGHVALWGLAFAEVAAAFWGAREILSVAGSEAGAPGAAPWQEATVTILHVVPASMLIAAWVALLWGMRVKRAAPAAAPLTVQGQGGAA